MLVWRQGGSVRLPTGSGCVSLARPGYGRNAGTYAGRVATSDYRKPGFYLRVNLGVRTHEERGSLGKS